MKLLNFSQLPIDAQILAKKNVQEHIFMEGSRIRELLTLRIRGSVESFGLPSAGLSILSISSSDFEVSITGDINLSRIITCNPKVFNKLPNSIVNKIELGVVAVRITSTPTPGGNGFVGSAHLDIAGISDMKERLLLEEAIGKIIEVAKIDAYARTVKNILTVCDRAGKAFNINGDLKVVLGSSAG